MIQNLSSGIVKWLLNAGAISQNDKELYEYAAYSLLFSFIPLILVIGISASLGMLPQGIAFVSPFLLLRKFSGGYHLSSPRICFLVSISVILVFLIVIKYMILANTYLICTPFALISAIQLMIFSPIDSNARKLSDKETLVFKCAVRIITVVTVCTFGLTAYIGQWWISICISMGLFLTACLQWPCLVKRKR